MIDDRAFVESQPDPEGLARMAEALGGGRVTEVERLLGGITCSTHRFRLGGQALVLKRDGLEGRTTLLREHACLVQAQRAEVATPEPIALDPAGQWFGVPALVMTAVPGRNRFDPTDLDRWLRGQVLALLRIHDTPIDGFGVDRPPRYLRWEPTGGLFTDEVSEVVARLAEVDEPVVFTHDDFHCGNVLFDGDDVVGVVDWAGARVEHRASDVANARKDLAACFSDEWADRFLAIYRAEWGAPLPNLDLWDALHGEVAIRWGHRWPAGLAEVGIHVSAETILQRSITFVAAALERAGIAT